jgi:L-iditol 2-dehydrogenase
MKAVVYPKPNSFEIREVDRPKVSAGQALVKVMSSTICGTDLRILSGEFPGIKFPHIPGHEWSGEVVEVAIDVDELKPGDRIGAEPHVGCGRCSNCLKGVYNLCENYGNTAKGHAHIGFTVPGGMAQYVAVSIKALHKLPSSLSYDEGAFTETVGVALYAIERVGIRAGDDVLIVGPGAIGLVAVQIARAEAANRVVIAGTRDERLSFAKKLGADESLNLTNVDDPISQIKSAFGGKGPDVVVEVAGSESAAELAVNVVKRGGRVVLAGATSPGKKLSVDISVIVRGHLNIFGSLANPKWICDRGIILMSRGYVDVKPLMTHGFRLEDFGKALETLRARQNGAFLVMIHPNGE